MFSEENVSAYKISDYVINLNEKELLYNSLYNLFNTKLKIFRDYLDNILIKN